MATTDLEKDLAPMSLGLDSYGAESEERNKDNLIHYQGELGDFWYDPNEFEVRKTSTAPPEGDDYRFLEEFYYLCYVGKGNSVSLPKGCINTRLMFFRHKLPKGFKLVDFDTSNVIDMSEMFSGCEMSEDISLGDQFDTSNVEDMHYMFYGCKFPAGFSLGGKFDTSNVINMDSMFHKCEFPEGFNLGHKFDTSRVTGMVSMFSNCNLPKGFSLGHKFDTSNVIKMDYMFYGCTLPSGFTLGDKFNISNDTDMFFMFVHCDLTGDSTFANIPDVEAKISYLRRPR